MTIVDLGLLAAHFLEIPLSDPRLDQNGDGEVDIVDLGIVAQYYLKSVSACPS